MRVQLSENIVITGGTTMIPGFLRRVQEELQHLIREPRYTNLLALKQFRYHTPPSKANFTAWLGGGICVCCHFFKSLMTTCNLDWAVFGRFLLCLYTYKEDVSLRIEFIYNSDN